MSGWKVTMALAVAMFVGCVSATAQQQEVRYLSKGGIAGVSASEAFYFEVTEANADGGGTITRYHMADSTKLRQHTYSDLDGGRNETGILEGPRYEWYANGNLKEQATYSNDELHGTYQGWHENGKLHFKKQYAQGTLQDSLIAYYETGEVRRVEVYRDGKMTSGKVYDRAGQEVKFIPMQQMPLFPGGESMMLRYLGRNIKYPKNMVKIGLQGLVVVSFVVRKDGTLHDLEIVKDLHPDGNAEAMRVVRNMPTWQPGLVEGEPVDVLYYLPVRYTIN